MLVFECVSGVFGVCSWVLEMGLNEATGWKNWGLAVLFGVIVPALQGCTW